jgi:hypothetical protein
VAARRTGSCATCVAACCSVHRSPFLSSLHRGDDGVTRLQTGLLRPYKTLDVPKNHAVVFAAYDAMSRAFVVVVVARKRHSHALLVDEKLSSPPLMDAVLVEVRVRTHTHIHTQHLNRDPRFVRLRR